MAKEFSEEPQSYRHAQKRGPKRAANVSIDAKLLVEAKALGINLSQTLEDELRKKVREENVRRFNEEHREAIEAHNKFIDEHGIWSEKFRTW